MSTMLFSKKELLHLIAFCARLLWAYDALVAVLSSWIIRSFSVGAGRTFLRQRPCLVEIYHRCLCNVNRKTERLWSVSSICSRVSGVIVSNSVSLTHSRVYVCPLRVSFGHYHVLYFVVVFREQIDQNLKSLGEIGCHNGHGSSKTLCSKALIFLDE